MLFYAGQTLNNLHVLESLGRNFYRVRCLQCGNESTVQSALLIRHSRKKMACYCARKKAISASKLKHGKWHSPLYSRWCCMKERCYRPKCNGYERYGGRGIKVCEEWHTYQNFERDMAEGFSKDKVLDRIDNNKDYSKTNCRWVTPKESANNRLMKPKVMYKSKLYSWDLLGKKLGIHPNVIRTRYMRGVRSSKLFQQPKWSRTK